MYPCGILYSPPFLLHESKIPVSLSQKNNMDNSCETTVEVDLFVYPCTPTHTKTILNEQEKKNKHKYSNSVHLLTFTNCALKNELKSYRLPDSVLGI